MNIKGIAVRVVVGLVIALPLPIVAQNWESGAERAEREAREDAKRKQEEEQAKKKAAIKASISTSTVTDPRDGQKYRTVKIDGKTWMAENLNYAIDGSGCYNNDASNCKKYGRLYKWDAAKDACLGMGDTWRLPTDRDWYNLVNFAGGWKVAGRTLKSMSGWNWNEYDNKNGNGTDDFGFSALPGGNRIYSDGRFNGTGNAGKWWSASKGAPGNASYWSMLHSNIYVADGIGYQSNGFSVRCVRTAELSTPTSTTPESAKVATIPTPAANKAASATPPTAIGQTNPVNSVKIGNLTWTKQNLNIETPGSWCYENKSANCVKYGRLYTWEDAKNACQSMGGAWQLPTNEDWDNLVKAVGGVRTVGKNKDGEYIYYTNAGKTLKSKSGWENNGNGTDNYGFSALPGGYHYAGGFLDAGRLSPWWSATEYDAGNAYSRSIHYNSDNVAESGYGKGGGFSARCVAND